MDKIWLALITGLTTGGISCFAVQGGLLASSLTQPGQEKEIDKKRKYVGVATFIFFKLFAYTLLGFFLGLIGASLSISPRVQAIFQLVVGLFLFATAGRLLNLHPIFRYFVIQPPTFVYRLAKKQTQARSFFAPALLGLFTVLLPCGITQAMMLVAIASGSPFLGAAIMFAFIVGTSPIFFLLGMAAVELLKKKAFAIIAAILILILGLFSLNSALNLWGSRFNLQNIFKGRATGNSARIDKGIQEVTIDAYANGYRTKVTTLKVGVPVRLTIVSNNVYSCARSFSIPQYNIVKLLPPTGNTTVEFTPKRTGRLVFTCTMGMYSGFFNITE